MALFNLEHYHALASVIANTDRYDDGDLIGPALAEAIIFMLVGDDPAFDRKTFEIDAGLVRKTVGFGQ